MEESRHETATRHVDGVESFTIWFARLLSCPPMNASQLSRGGRAREMWWKPWMASVWLPALKAAYLVGVASGDQGAGEIIIRGCLVSASLASLVDLVAPGRRQTLGQ